MKSTLSNLDLYCITRELSFLNGAKIEKIYHVNDEFILKLYVNQAHYALRVIKGSLIHVTSYLKDNPEVPSHFCMYLRKYLQGGRILSINQPGMERIIELRIDARSEHFRLIFELFSKGNVIVTDDAHFIKQVLEVQHYGVRDLKPKRDYIYPPQKFNLSSLDVLSLSRALKSSNKDKLVSALAVDVSLGGSYAEEVCFLSGVDKNKAPQSLTDKDVESCYESLNFILKQVKYAELAPRVILKSGSPVDVIPFPLKIYEGFEFKSFPDYNSALDYYYVASQKAQFEQEKDEALNSSRDKFLNQIRGQEERLEDLKKESSSLRSKADALKQNLYLISSIQESLLNAKRGGYSWQEINSMLDKERDAGSPEASLVKELRGDDMIIVLDIGEGLEIGLNEDAPELMNSFFEKAKKIESKFEGVNDYINECKKKLDSLDIDSISVSADVPKRAVHKKSSEWYSRFKWFYSSEGYLVVSARDAHQNEELVTKYVEPDDLVFHADVHGSPFTIVRNGRSATDKTFLEAGQFTVAHSRAWELKSPADVYYVSPHQVSKQAPAGEYVMTGSFMIRGKKTYFKSVIPELCVGVIELPDLNYELVTGPKSAIKPRAKRVLTLRPGDDSKSGVINEIREYFKTQGYNIPTEELQQSLPSKGFKLIKF